MIETVSFGLLYPALLAVVPNTSTQWLNFYIAHAVTDLALRTRVVRYVFTQDAQENVSRYFIDLPEGYTLAYVESVCINGNRYRSTRAPMCDPVDPELGPCSALPPSLCSAATSEMPRWSFNVSTDGSYYTVNPAPAVDSVDGVVTEVSLAPLRTACEMPKVLYERHAQKVIDMAVAQLSMNAAAKLPVTAQRIAAARATNAERRAKLDADSDRAVGPGRLRPPIRDFLL